VTAIEAHPRTFGFLQANARLNPGLRLSALNFAAGESEGTLRFTNLRGDDQNGVSDQGEVEVAVRRLDQLLAGQEPIELLKLDVEGFELSVLRGAPEVLRRTRCVYFEVSQRSQDYGHPAEEVLRVLDASGFTLLWPQGGAVERPFVAGRRATNLVAVRDAARYRERMGLAQAAAPALV
jgi:FkbM family methyltransferase